MFLNADLFLQYRFKFGLIDESFDPSVDIDIRLFEVLENEKKPLPLYHICTSSVRCNVLGALDQVLFRAHSQR